MHDFLEMALFDLSEATATMFDFHFGPKRYRITGTTSTTLMVRDRG